MNVKQIKEIIVKGEGVTIEFKDSSEDLSSSAFESVCSFLNTIGGHLLLGITDDGDIVGIDEDDVDVIKTKFADMINNKNKVNPPLPLTLQEYYVDGKVILHTYIPESSEVHKLNGSIIFVRTEDGDRDITENSYATKRLYLRKSGKRSEDKVFPDVTLNDFNKRTIAKAKKLAKIYSPEIKWDKLSDEEILKQKKFYKKDIFTGEEGFTLSSLLLFGKKDVINDKLSWYKVDVLKKIRDVVRFDDRFICEENLIDSYDLLIKYICDNVDKPFYLSKDGVTYNAVGVVIRELVSNILIHREYMDMGPSRILLYKDKIVTQNPNSPRIFTKMDTANFEPFSKNPSIAWVFRMIGYADEAGSGFHKINEACKEYFNSNPEAYDRDTFETEINLVSIEDEIIEALSQEDKIIKYVEKLGKITSSECKDLLKLERTRVGDLLTGLVNKKVLFRHGNGRSTYYDFNK